MKVKKKKLVLLFWGSVSVFILGSIIYAYLYENPFVRYHHFFQVFEEEQVSYYDSKFLSNNLCSSTSEASLEQINTIVQSTIDQYPTMIQNLEYKILLCNQMNNGQYLGLYLHQEQDQKQIHLALQVNENIIHHPNFERMMTLILHHELFHVMDYNYLQEYWDEDPYLYQQYNTTYLPQSFISIYAQKDGKEDRAETFKYLMLEQGDGIPYFKEERVVEKANQLKQELADAFPDWTYLQ